MKVLLAVSGGADSMYLCAKAPEFFPGASFAVAHCNFGLRGAESDADEAFVREWCKGKGLNLFVQRFDTNSYALSKGISTEMAARELRYGWFAQLAREEGFDAVAVAHNSNDNAETLLLNLLRGTGSRGLRGMAQSSLQGGLKILRPMLGVSRPQILEWLSQNGVPHREDSSNSQDIYKRNLLRHKVMPVFEQINPSYLRTLSDDMRHFAQTLDIAQEYFESAEQKVRIPGTRNEFSIEALLSFKHWKYVLYRLLEPFGFSENTLESLAGLLESGSRTLSGKTFESPVYKAVTGGGRITVLEREAAPATPQFSMRKFPRPEGLQLKQPSGTIILDADKTGEPRFRHWQSGDWMRPLGLRGKKKLSDLFADLKWSLPQKEACLVLEHPDSAPGHVGALLCERIDESLKVGPETRIILEITLQQ